MLQCSQYFVQCLPYRHRSWAQSGADAASVKGGLMELSASSVILVDLCLQQAVLCGAPCASRSVAFAAEAVWGLRGGRSTCVQPDQRGRWGGVLLVPVWRAPGDVADALGGRAGLRRPPVAPSDRG